MNSIQAHSREVSVRGSGTPAYAELHGISNFSFLRGASHPEELVARAAELGYTALALTDECSFAGVVRAHVAAKEHAFKLIIGTELHLVDGPQLVLLASSRNGYGALSELISRGRWAAGKGAYRLSCADLEGGLPDCLALLLHGESTAYRQLRWAARCFPKRLWLAVELLQDGQDKVRLARLRELGQRTKLPLVAAGDIHMHSPARRPLQDTLTAIRLGCPVSGAGDALHANGERHLRGRQQLAQFYPQELLEASVAVAERCDFSLDELRYEYPEELVPSGKTPASHLRALTRAGMKRRWPAGAPERVRKLVARELELISELGYEPYFLTVHDLVCFAHRRGILCQGRGSAANSAVCYCLGITAVDPARMEMLFERFISRERDEPPDIDVDFEHERREEVIQYIYQKYGRHRAALTATVISYRPRSALRDVGKALGLDGAQLERLAASVAWWDGSQMLAERLREAGFEPDNPVIHQLMVLVEQLIGFPRHLSQHVGGFVIARDRLSQLVPIENAAMANRTVIQWDKDDLDTLGLLKVDVLGLGMLSVIRRALKLVSHARSQPMDLVDIPAEDPAVYRMICRADTLGVFQIESRAQMAMLPRLLPRCFYDLVIEIAIVRPGPIQGGMVHPYLRRRQGKEAIDYPSPAVRKVLERTLGIPIFQEQVMQLAVVAAGFSPGEADQLRRAMAAWRRKGGLGPFEARLIEGMRARGYSAEFSQRVFQQIQGFGEYGFPESHAASFALLVYVSAWLKCHHPAAFTCALLNSQPMGFYAPAQIIQDLRTHGVAVLAVDVRYSDWDCTLIRAADKGGPALRLGLCMVKGFSRSSADRLINSRGPAASWRSVEVLARQSGLPRKKLQCLAAVGALAGLAGNRHQAQWAVLGTDAMPPLLRHSAFAEASPLLPVPTEGADLVMDYANLGFSLGRHPLALLRGHFHRDVYNAARIDKSRHGQRIRVVGLVINRQRPSTAAGTVFMTLEDETGHVNVVLRPQLVERERSLVLGGRLLEIRGKIAREGRVIHVLASGLANHDALLGQLETRSRDFH